MATKNTKGTKKVRDEPRMKNGFARKGGDGWLIGRVLRCKTYPQTLTPNALQEGEGTVERGAAMVGDSPGAGLLPAGGDCELAGSAGRRRAWAT